MFSSNLIKNSNFFIFVKPCIFSKFYKHSNFHFFKRTTVKNRNRNYNFYEVLRVERNCSCEEIRAAYLKLAKQYHPDINKDPGSDDKFKTLTLAYEALSNQRNRDLYDAYMENDPCSQEWKYKEEHYREEQGGSERTFYKERAKYDKYSQNFYKNQEESNFWQNKQEDFAGEFYKDFENIFKNQSGGDGFKKSKKEQKAEDILLEIQIKLEESFHGGQKGLKFKRIEKCNSCNGYRSAPGHRPSKCFTCNGLGEIKTSMFNSKKCNQCRGVGFIIKYPCKECEAKGTKEYEVEEIIPIPKGIRTGTNIRMEKKGHASETPEILSGDLLVKVVVDASHLTNITRLGEDLHHLIEINLVDAIFGTQKEIKTLDDKIEIIEIRAGHQTDEQVIFENRGFVNPDDKNFARGKLIVNFKIKIPSGNNFSEEDKKQIKKLFNF